LHIFDWPVLLLDDVSMGCSKFDGRSGFIYMYSTIQQQQLKVLYIKYERHKKLVRQKDEAVFSVMLV